MAFGMSPFPLQFGTRGGGATPVLAITTEGDCIVVTTLRSASPTFTTEGDCINITGVRVR